MSEHHFTAEGAPCQNCGVLLDDKAAGKPCPHDPGDLTPLEIGAAVAALVGIVFACVALVWSEDWATPIIKPSSTQADAR